MVWAELVSGPSWPASHLAQQTVNLIFSLNIPIIGLQLNDEEISPQIITYEIILKQLFTLGSVINMNKNLDFVSVFIHR